MSRIDERKYVLRSNQRVATDPNYQYYTGARPTLKIGQAKQFSLSQAKSIKQFATSCFGATIIRVTNKMLFMATLKGK